MAIIKINQCKIQRWKSSAPGSRSHNE